MTAVFAAAESPATTSHPIWHFALVAALGLAAFLVINVRERLERRQLTRASGYPTKSTQRLWLGVLAVASVGAAGFHGVLCPEHFREATLFGVFFAATAALQLVWALLVIARPSGHTLLFGAVVNACVVAVWLMSRTTGLPVGPELWEREAITTADAVTTVFEVIIVAGASWLLLRRRALQL